MLDAEVEVHSSLGGGWLVGWSGTMCLMVRGGAVANVRTNRLWSIVPRGVGVHTTSLTARFILFFGAARSGPVAGLMTTRQGWCRACFLCVNILSSCHLQSE
jgi:hypothetical protein